MLRFTTNAYPREQRLDAWRFALQRVSITFGAADANLYGELLSFRGELGVEFIALAATPQQFTLDYREQRDCFWLTMLLDGTARATSGSHTVEVADGDIAFGRGAFATTFDVASDAHLLIVKLPASLINVRLRGPLPDRIGRLAGDGGASRMLAGMLRPVAAAIGDVTADQIRPVELGLPEFLIAALLDDAPPRALGGAAGMRAALLERIFQTIEMRLSDPELNLQQIASEHGVSPRYLQKLFESVDDSFGHYVKLRRLERCRLDLRSPLHAQKSISDILFQWGFNDSASFSRAFREQYDTSPRDYRKAPPAEDQDAVPPRRGRPAARRDRRAIPGDQAEDGATPASDLEEQAESGVGPGVRHHLLPISPETIHWGFFSRTLKPVLEVRSGDYVTIETLTHHANDDPERMVEGDPGAESVYRWTADEKAVERRGAGPFDASAYGRGPGEGFGVHICTGPIAIAGAEPGDIVEVRVLDIRPRPSGNTRFAGRSFGSNAAAFWGFQYNDLLTEPRPREVVTIYEVERGDGRPCAHAVYSYRWTPQTDPSGVVHDRIDYPGVPVDPGNIERNFDVLRNIEVPIRPHFGVIGLAPAHAGLIDSVPPSAFGGNLDNWRTGPGSRIYLPVAVRGGLLSIGDPHASQGDGEICGTAIECSMTGVVQIILHPARDIVAGPLRDLDYPLIETDEEWVLLGFSYPDYLKELGDAAQSEIYKHSSVDAAMRDAFRKARRFLMTAKGLSEDEALSLLSVGVDFGVTQVVNGNWGAHAIIRKAMFTA